jgi:hypothetical protein
MREMDKRLLKFVGDYLLKDVDVEKEKIGFGKTLWDDFEVEDDGEDVAYVELYAEIPLEDLNEFAFETDRGIDILINDIKEMVKERPDLLIDYVFYFNDNLELIPELEQIEAYDELDKEDELFIVQINLLARPTGVENE